MGYKVILRVGKIKSFGHLKEYMLHVNREKEVANANGELSELNFQLRGDSNVVATVDKFIKDRGIKITKGKNKSVLCTEMLLTASKDFFRNPDGTLDMQKTERWIMENEMWLREKYGENYLFGKVHLDETSPHISAIICATKYNKAYKREVLAHKAWFGKTVNKAKNIYINKLEDLQTEYAERMQEAGFNLERGQQKSKATHKDIQTFYTDINKAKQMVTELLEEKDLLIKQVQEDNAEKELNYKVEINARNAIINQLAKAYEVEKYVQQAYPKARELAEDKLKGKFKDNEKNGEELEL